MACVPAPAARIRTAAVRSVRGWFAAARCADDLAAVLDAFNLHDVTLVTFSAGSGEAVRYLTRHGTGRIARLAMIAPTTPLLARQDDNPDGD